MTVKAYISREANSGDESGFEYNFERAAALQIVKAVWQVYNAQPTSHYALIANIASPAIDMVILSNQGLGIIDLKNYGGPIKGTDQSPWWIVDPRGQPVTQLMKDANYINPFLQVQTYGRKLFGHLKSFARTNGNRVPAWLLNESFKTQAAVVFTAEKFNRSGIKIDPAMGSPWFQLLWLDEVAEWAYSLEFGQNYRTRQKFSLTSNQIDYLATNLFSTTPWVEIDGHLTSNEPYGYLWVMVEGKETSPRPLDLDEVAIGRDSHNPIMLDPSTYPRVSRIHAKIRRSANQVFITDNESKLGTWINSKQLQGDASHRLVTGDRIVLGSCTADGQATSGSCTLIYRAKGMIVAPTLDQTIG